MAIIRDVIRGVVGSVVRSVSPLGALLNKQLIIDLIQKSSETIISFSRASPLAVVDHEGKTVTTLPEESGFTGARRVENLFTETEDLSGAPWGLTLNGGATAVFSPDNSMVTLTCFSGGDRAYLTYGFTTLAGLEYRSSFLQTILSGNVTGGSFVLTGGQDQTGLVTVDVSGKAQSAIISDAIGASGSLRMGIGVSSGSTLPASIQLSLPQLEDVTGNLDNNASEFVSSVDHGANVNGVQWFDTALGSNVLLTTLRGMLNTSSTLVTYPSLTPPILNDFKVEVSVTADQAMGTVHIISAYIDSNNYTSILHNGVNIIARKRISGVNNDANFALPTLVVGTTYDIMATFSSVNGIDITVNGSAGSNNPNTADTAAATNNFIGSANGSNEFLGSIKNIFIG